MKNLLAGIMTKCAGSAFSTDLGGRIYEANAPQHADYPYCVFSIIGGGDEGTFTETIDDVTVQFSLFSISSGPGEVGTAYADLIALFDNATLTIAGDAFLRCVRNGPPMTMFDYVTTETGEVGLRHWAVDYSIMVQD
jgi:hypothetical protein